jgi:N-dimethylarginine dimethylaminohydrolase
MLRVLIRPTTFTILPMQDKQNPYIDIHHDVNHSTVMHQHSQVEHAFQNTIAYTVPTVGMGLPDIVFTANAGLCLPRLPTPTILLPYMKYPQRKEELPHLTRIYKELGLHMIPFPGAPDAPFEGQAELKWFHGGTKAVCGYGHRSTKKSFHIAQKLFETIYTKHHMAPPELLILPLASDQYYHLDVAMLEFSDTECIVHKHAISAASIAKLKKFLGPNSVHVIDTPDSFCLNAVVDGPYLITHQLTQSLKKELEHITRKTIHMVNTSEFEKSGGSVRCMTLDILR